MVAYLFDDCLLVIKTDCGKTWWYLTVPETYLPPFTYGYGSYTKPFAFVLLSRFNLREKINLPKKLVEINKNNFGGESRIASTPCDKNQ